MDCVIKTTFFHLLLSLLQRVNRFGTFTVTDKFGQEDPNYEDFFQPTVAQEMAIEQYKLRQERLQEQREMQEEALRGTQQQTNEQFLQLLRQNPQLLTNLLQGNGGAAAALGVGAA